MANWRLVKRSSDPNFVSNQPVQVSGSSSGGYKYDGNFKRVKAVVDGKQIYNVYDSTGRLVHINNTSDNKVTEYIHGAGKTLARFTNNEVTYLHNDHLGSPIAATRRADDILWREEYTPYGEKMIDNSANDDLGGFTGHIDDSSTGLTYMQARYYDPVMGRFLSNDPVDFLGHLQLGNSPAHGFGRYTYANNNPMNRIDPDGNSSHNPRGMAGTLQGLSTADKMAGARAVLGVTPAGRMVNIGKAILGAMLNESSEIEGAVDLVDDLAGQEVVGEIEAGEGTVLDGMADKKFDPETGTHDKVVKNRTNADGTQTEVHTEKNRKTDKVDKAKIKQDGSKSRENNFE